MHFSLAFILFIRIFGFVNESNKQIDTFSQLRLPLIVLITFAHSYSGVRAGWTLWDGGWDAYEVLKLIKVNVTGNIDQFADDVWTSLNEDNKVSLFVRYIDIATGEKETRIFNKNTKEENA